MKPLDLESIRRPRKIQKNHIHPLIWSAITRLLSILRVRARFQVPRGSRMRGWERASKQTSQRYRAAWISYTSRRIKCRRERDFRLFVKRTPPRCRRWWTDDAGFSRRSSWAAVFHWRTHSSSPTIIPTSSSRRWVSLFYGFLCSNDCCDITKHSTKCVATDGILNVS